MTDAPAAVIPRPGFLDIPAVAASLAALPGARAVGGCVRDALAGLGSADIDIAAPLPPTEIAARLRAAGLRVFETGLAHGTVTAVRDHVPVEVTALRRDVLTDGRHAVVEWTTDWREDAARRDFTINAMSLAPDGSLFDYFGGREDLAAGHVRFVGDPDTRLAEDYLRALRFFRFQARYGTREPDAAALGAIARAVPGLARLSAERVWMEIKRILSVPDPVAAVELMARTGVLGAVLPEVAGTGLLAALTALGGPPDVLLRFAALLPDPPPEGADMLGALSRRLRLSGAESAALRAMKRPMAWGGLAPGMARESVVRLLGAASVGAGMAAEDDPGRSLGWLIRMNAARSLHATGDATQARAWLALGEVVARTEVPVFPLAGRDVLALGAEPGPAVGAWLAQMRLWWVEGGCTATPEEMLAELRHRMDAQRAATDGGGAALGGRVGDPAPPPAPERNEN